ncbi:3-oxoadipate enol-lactone hydrolase-like protein [Stipitochalara longipes BDJ]|nr:3-oxoadipate enol-lactone hydrolase-like protein [Stipitochalara longipes BDJ]
MPSIKVNEKSVFYTLDQDDDQPAKLTALFIHGLGSSSCFYKTITPSFISTTRCISMDTPGSGLSELGNTEQSISSIAKDAIRLLDVLQIHEKVVVIGHSMGGIVASYIAAEFPDRVKGVVLIGPVNPDPALVSVFEKRIEVVKKDGLEALANNIPTGATGSKAGPLQHAFIRSLILGTSSEGYISLCNVIAKASKPDYSSIEAPLLILVGAEDKTAPLASSEAILNTYGTSKERKKLEILDGVGHWHCVEAVDDVARHLVTFIGSLS